MELEPPYEIEDSHFFTEVDWVEESRIELEKAEIRGDVATINRIEKWLRGGKLDVTGMEFYEIGKSSKKVEESGKASGESAGVVRKVA